MSYVFFPPRVANYYPGGPPYLSGLRGMRGLGDYATDLAAYNRALAAYNADYAAWKQEKAAYDAATAAYPAAHTAYQVDTLKWNTESIKYKAALNTYNTQYAGIKKDNTTRSQTIAKSYGLSLPQSYYDGGACLSQAQHDAYAAQCVTVKGLLGIGLGSSDPNCGYKALPVCAYPAPPTLRAKPTPPTVPTLRAVPVAPMAPTPPAATTPSGGGNGGNGGGSALVPTPPSTDNPLTPDDAPTKQSGMIMNGLLIVAVLGGGYLIYRTIKKPKAA